MNSIKDMENFMNDIKGNFPSIKPSEITKLIDSGINVDKLQNLDNTKGINGENGENIIIDSYYKCQGPSTNVNKLDFYATAKLYSPYLYYNKGMNEKHN